MSECESCLEVWVGDVPAWVKVGFGLFEVSWVGCGLGSEISCSGFEGFGFGLAKDHFNF